MAYRVACDHSDIVTAIMSVCGAPYSDLEKCSASPIHTLSILGMTDPLLLYDGRPPNLASGPINTKRWATQINECDDAVDQTSEYSTADSASDHFWGAKLDEVIVAKYKNCAAETELWSVPGVGHCPGINYFNMNWLLSKRRLTG